jgi:transposase
MMETVCNNKGFDNIIVGMEPTGHYWKPLANYPLELLRDYL